MAESPRRSASGGGGGHRQPTHPSVTLSNENGPGRSQPAPEPCPAANGALRAAEGRPPADSALPSQPLDREVCRCATTATTSATTARPVAAQPGR
jgi:hypothetical protein